MSGAGRKTRVGVIFGGRSGEHDVSLTSACSVMDYLDRDKYEVMPIGITREGKWIPHITPWELLEAERRKADGEVSGRSERHFVSLNASAIIPGEVLASLERSLDVVFPLLHGVYGEDGVVQGLLELLNKPYVGCGVLGSALGMDKEKMKLIFRAVGIPTVESRTYQRHHWERSSSREILRDIEENLGYPCFVKPANGGSSIGVSKVCCRRELESAFQLAAEYDSKIIVERAIVSRELACAVLGNLEPIASVVGEVIVAHDFYDYEAKYLDDSTRTVVPADIPRSIAERLRSQAIQAFSALDLCGMARVDFFWEKGTDHLFINEVNTWPSFTHLCMYSKLCAASGVPYTLLLDRLILLAFERYADRQRNRTSLHRERTMQFLVPEEDRCCLTAFAGGNV